MTKDIFAVVEEITRSTDTDALATVDISLESNTLSSNEIMKWVRTVHAAYKEQLRNSLGDSIYFFDNKVKETGSGDPRGPVAVDASSDGMSRMKRVMKLNNAPKQLGFLKSPFYSNKTFDNIFGPEVRPFCGFHPQLLAHRVAVRRSERSLTAWTFS